MNILMCDHEEIQKQLKEVVHLHGLPPAYCPECLSGCYLSWDSNNNSIMKCHKCAWEGAKALIIYDPSLETLLDWLNDVKYEIHHGTAVDVEDYSVYFIIDKKKERGFIDHDLRENLLQLWMYSNHGLIWNNETLNWETEDEE